MAWPCGTDAHSHALASASRASLARRVFWFTARCLRNVLNWKRAWLLADSSFLTLLKKECNEDAEGMLTSSQSRKLIHRMDPGTFLERLMFFTLVIIWKSNMWMTKSEPDTLACHASSAELPVKMAEAYRPIWQTVKFWKVKIYQIRKKIIVKVLKDLDFV